MSSRRVLALAVPALGSLTADPLLSLVDTAFVARLGPVPLAALAVDVSILTFAFAVFNFLAYATTPLVARARAQGLAESGRIIQRALTLAVVIGVVAAGGLVIAAPGLVRLMQAPPEVVDSATGYLRLRALGIPGLLIVTAGHGAFRGLEDTRTALWVAVAMNALNALLGAVLIFGIGLGLDGAGIATAVAQWAGAGIFLGLLFRRGRVERWPPGRPSFIELAAFLRVGWVLVIRSLLLVATLSAATAAAARLGTIELAAHQIVSQVWFLLALVVDSLAIAAQTLVSQAAGAGDGLGARRTSELLLRWGLVLGTGLGAGLWLVGPHLGGWLGADLAVATAVTEVSSIAGLMQPLAALVFVGDGIFLAMLALGRLAASTAAGLAAALSVLGFASTRGWGLPGVWWAIFAMIVARGLVLAGGYGRTLARL